MAKRRKSEATARLEEVDRTTYTTFCTAANSLSHLYTHAMNHQRLSFHAGERHSLEKLYQWILRRQEEGSRVTDVDIISYIQREIDYGAEESPISPRLPFQHQHSQTAAQFSNPSFQGIQSVHTDHQSKSSVFSNALSSPVRWSLQHYHLEQASYTPNSVVMPSGNEANCDLQPNRDSDPPSSNDSSMDMQ